MELLFCPQANGAPELSNQSSAFVFFVLILGAKILTPSKTSFLAIFFCSDANALFRTFTSEIHVQHGYSYSY